MTLRAGKAEGAGGRRWQPSPQRRRGTEEGIAAARVLDGSREALPALLAGRDEPKRRRRWRAYGWMRDRNAPAVPASAIRGPAAELPERPTGGLRRGTAARDCRTGHGPGTGRAPASSVGRRSPLRRPSAVVPGPIAFPSGPNLCNLCTRVLDTQGSRRYQAGAFRRRVCAEERQWTSGRVGQTSPSRSG
jgi:hypothetical protein